MFAIFNGKYKLSIDIDKSKKYTKPAKDFILNFFNNPTEDVEIKTPFPELFFADFSNHFEIVEAAGGLVFHEDRLLMIHRLGYWDLPKGKIDPKESALITAVREIKEECNVEVTSVPYAFFDTTYHLYQQNGKQILKRTYWFVFFVKEAGLLIPQTVEDIDRVEWINAETWQAVKKETYPSIVQVIEKTSVWGF